MDVDPSAVQLGTKYESFASPTVFLGQPTTIIFAIIAREDDADASIQRARAQVIAALQTGFNRVDWGSPLAQETQVLVFGLWFELVRVIAKQLLAVSDKVRVREVAAAVDERFNKLTDREKLDYTDEIIAEYRRTLQAGDPPTYYVTTQILQRLSREETVRRGEKDLLAVMRYIRLRLMPEFWQIQQGAESWLEKMVSNARSLQVLKQQFRAGAALEAPLSGDDQRTLRDQLANCETQKGSLQHELVSWRDTYMRGSAHGKTASQLAHMYEMLDKRYQECIATEDKNRQDLAALTVERDKLSVEKTRLSGVEKDLKKARTDVERLQKELASKAKELETKVSSRDLEKANATIQTLRKEIAKLETKLHTAERHEGALAEGQKALDELRDQLKAEQEDKARVIAYEAARRDRLYELAAEDQRKLTEAKKKAEEELAQCTAEKEQMRTSLDATQEELRAENIICKRQLNESKARATQLEQQLQTSTARATQLDQQLQDSIALATRLGQERDNLKRELSTRATTVLSSDEARAAVERDLKQLSEEKTALVVKNNTLTTQLSVANAQVTQLTNELGSKTEERRTALEQLAKCTAEKEQAQKSFESANQELRAQNIELESKLRASNARITQLEQTPSSARPEADAPDIARLVAENGTLTAQVTQLKVALDFAQKRLETANEQFQASYKKLLLDKTASESSAAEQTSALTRQLDAANVEVSRLEEELRRTSALQAATTTRPGVEEIKNTPEYRDVENRFLNLTSVCNELTEGTVLKLQQELAVSIDLERELEETDRRVTSIGAEIVNALKKEADYVTRYNELLAKAQELFQHIPVRLIGGVPIARGEKDWQQLILAEAKVADLQRDRLLAAEINVRVLHITAEEIVELLDRLYNIPSAFPKDMQVAERRRQYLEPLRTAWSDMKQKMRTADDLTQIILKELDETQPTITSQRDAPGRVTGAMHEELKRVIVARTKRLAEYFSVDVLNQYLKLVMELNAKLKELTAVQIIASDEISDELAALSDTLVSHKPNIKEKSKSFINAVKARRPVRTTRTTLARPNANRGSRAFLPTATVASAETSLASAPAPGTLAEGLTMLPAPTTSLATLPTDQPTTATQAATAAATTQPMQVTTISPIEPPPELPTTAAGQPSMQQKPKGRTAEQAGMVTSATPTAEGLKQAPRTKQAAIRLRDPQRTEDAITDQQNGFDIIAAFIKNELFDKPAAAADYDKKNIIEPIEDDCGNNELTLPQQDESGGDSNKLVAEDLVELKLN